MSQGRETEVVTGDDAGSLDSEVLEEKEVPAQVIEPIKPRQTPVPDLHPLVEVPQKDDPRLFVHLREDGTVRAIITEREDITQEWPKKFLDDCIEITDHQTKPEVGWLRKGNGQFGPVERVVSLDMKARAALAGGLKIGKSTFDVSGPRWQEMRDEASHVATFQEFSSGGQDLTWRDRDGKNVQFKSTADFMKTVRALSRLVLQWQRFGSGADVKEPVRETSAD